MRLEAILGAKDTAWLTGPFMSAFGPQLLTVEVLSAEDLLLLTPQQALLISWSESGRPFTVAKNRLQHLLQQIRHADRLSAVLHRFGEKISTLLGTCKGQRCYCERLLSTSTPDVTPNTLPEPVAEWLSRVIQPSCISVCRIACSC